MFPAASMICGVTIDEWLGEKRRIGQAMFWLVFTGFAIVFINATPIKLSKEREHDTRILAPYVHQFASQHYHIVAFRQSYHTLNNALLFYSDFSASPILYNYDELHNLFINSDTVFCILNNSDIDSLSKCVIPYTIIRETDDISLIVNHPVQTYNLRNY